MIIIILVLVAFLILVYVYHYIKWKKRKNQTADAVESFRKSYVERISNRREKKETINYTARNNNLVDYIEKESYMNEETIQ